MSTEHLTAGEWERWLADDRQWKGVVLNHVIESSERLARLEARDDAGRAERAADTTKRWTVIATIVTAVVNGALLAFGVKIG